MKIRNSCKQHFDNLEPKSFESSSMFGKISLQNQWSLSCFHFHTWCEMKGKSSNWSFNSLTWLLLFPLEARTFLFISAKFSNRYNLRDCGILGRLLFSYKNRTSIHLTRATRQQRRTFLFEGGTVKSAVLFSSAIKLLFAFFRCSSFEIFVKKIAAVS